MNRLKTFESERYVGGARSEISKIESAGGVGISGLDNLKGGFLELDLDPLVGIALVWNHDFAANGVVVNPVPLLILRRLSERERTR
jgi:hypothetical protein